MADRLSWMRFCGLGPGDAVPDANTLWDFREALIGAGGFDVLFARLDRAITEAGYLAMSGQILDATLVAAPRQRNTEGEKAAIKAGKTAADIWPEKPAKARQKDVDARWTMKFSKARPVPRRLTADRHCRPDLRLQVAYLDRSAARDHSPPEGHRRGGA